MWGAVRACAVHPTQWLCPIQHTRPCKIRRVSDGRLWRGSARPCSPACPTARKCASPATARKPPCNTFSPRWATNTPWRYVHTAMFTGRGGCAAPPLLHGTAADAPSPLPLRPTIRNHRPTVQGKRIRARQSAGDRVIRLRGSCAQATHVSQRLTTLCGAGGAGGRPACGCRGLVRSSPPCAPRRSCYTALPSL